MLIIVALCLIGTRYWKEAREWEERKIWNTIANLAVIDAQKSRSIDNWWIKTSNLSANIETKQLFEKKKNEVLSIIHNYRGVSAETEKISERFREFRLAVFVNGQSRYLLENGITPPLGTNGVDICFLSEEDARKLLFYSIAWRPDWNTVIIPAVSYPEKLLVSLLFHELGHAFRHNKNDAGGIVPDIDKEALAREEVEMHELSGEILNNLSNESYFRRIDQILARLPKERRFERVIASVTTEDSVAFYEIFGCAGTETPAKMVMSNTIRMIGFRHAERHELGIEGKIKVFREIERHLALPEK